MLKDTLKVLKENPIGLKITGKSLIYSVDLEGALHSDQSEITLRIGGQIRFGVLKSQGEFLSRYQTSEEKVKFLEHRLEFPKIFFKEQYESTDVGLTFQKNKGPLKDVELKDPLIMDPLPLMFKLLTLDRKEDNRFDGYILVGGKQKSFCFKQKQNDFMVEVDKKPLFEGCLLADQVTITISSLKVKLVIQRI